jgi:hypothetical protein
MVIAGGTSMTTAGIETTAIATLGMTATMTAVD